MPATPPRSGRAVSPSAMARQNTPAARRRQPHLPEQARWLAQVGATDPAARLDAVPGDRTTRQIGALLLRLDADAEGLGKAPRRQEQHGADAAAEIHEASRRGLPQEFGAEPRRHEVVEGPAVAAHQLQDAPVAGEVAEVLAHTGYRSGRSSGVAGRGPGARQPAGRRARRTIPAAAVTRSPVTWSQGARPDS